MDASAFTPGVVIDGHRFTQMRELGGGLGTQSESLDIWVFENQDVECVVMLTV